MKQNTDYLSKPHLVSRMLQESVFYPPHSPRKESKEYAKVHHQMVVVEDLPCIQCGLRNSQLKDPTHNKLGAKQIESHHAHIEWSLQNAISLERFNKYFLPHIRTKFPNDPDLDHDFVQQEMLDFIDHSRHNLVVLCDFHHRHKLVGIHSVTGPVWGPQNLIIEGYKYTP